MASLSPHYLGFGLIGKAVCNAYWYLFGGAAALAGLGITYKLSGILADYSLALEECDRIKHSLKLLLEKFDKVKKVRMESLEKKIKTL